MKAGKQIKAWMLAACSTAFLLGASADAQQATTYVYDALGRLTRVTHPNSTVTTYAYDPAGNRTSMTSAPNNAGTPTATNDVAYAYPMNVPPYLVAEAIALVRPLDNDVEPNGAPLSIASTTNGAHGSVYVSGSLLSYVSNVTTNGTDTFNYTATNGHNASAAATVTIQRRPQEATPYALADVVHAYPINAPPYLVGSAFAWFDPTANDYDHNGAPLTVTAVTQGTQGGYVGIAPPYGVLYLANPSSPSTDTFTYTISNGAGGTKTATVTVYRHP